MENYSKHSSLSGKRHMYSFRNVFETYRDCNGACWVLANPPKISTGTETDDIIYMVYTGNIVGIVKDGKYVGPIPKMYKRSDKLIEFLIR